MMKEVVTYFISPMDFFIASLHLEKKVQKAVTGGEPFQIVGFFTLFTPKGCIYTIKVDFSRPEIVHINAF